MKLSHHHAVISFSLLLLVAVTGCSKRHHDNHAVPTVSSIVVTPANSTVAVAASRQFSATATYSDGSTKDVTASAAWTASSSAATVSATGLATGVSAGSATISATVSAMSGGATLTITAAVNGTSPQVTVTSQVIDTELSRPLAGLVLTFTAGATPISATTNNHGTFTAALAPGSYSLAISQGITMLLTTSVTIGADGSIAEYPTTIAVALPANPIATFLRESTPIHAALSVSPDAPTSGQSVTVAYSDATSTATSVNVAFTGAGCGSLTSAQMNGFRYQQVATVGAAGTCHVVATVAFPSGPQILTTQFKVEPTSVVLPALSIVGGSFIAGDSIPAPRNLTGTTAIASVTAPGTLINGATERFVVVPAGEPNGAHLISFLVQVAGATGYFSVPAQKDANGNYYFDLVLNQDFFTTGTNAQLGTSHASTMKRAQSSMLTSNGRVGAAAIAALTGSGASLTLNVATTDSQGNISNATSNTSMTQQVGSGTLQVSLSWDAAVDLDLQVVEPDGEDIAFYNLTASDGGTLDLDSNAACIIDGINNENVTWPSPAVPTPTTGNQKYAVRVDYYSACPDQHVNYQVTVNNCSAVAQFSGSFDPSQADGDTTGAGVTITSFAFTGCNGSTVSGRATYDDYQASQAGLSTTPTPLPIRDATVLVRSEEDLSVIQTGSTDDDGNFNLTFKNNSGTPGYYVTINATSPASDTTVRQQVTNDAGGVYVYQSDFYNETAVPNNTGLNLHVTQEDGAAAFNIYDQGVSAFRFMAPFVVGLGTPKTLTWLWQQGEDSPDCPGSSCWVSQKQQVQIKSIDTGSDEYYDSVMLHEFGHYFQYYFGSQSNPGGAHGFNHRYTPTSAWSEGFATFFGQSVKGSPNYIYVYENGDCVCTNLDVPLAADIPLGTEDNVGHAPSVQTGFLSEVLVASGLWNLEQQYGAAPVFQTSGDMVVLTHPAATLRDIGGWDAVDFMDTWFCLSNPRGAATSGFQQLINGTLQFPYDYSAPCTPTPSGVARPSINRAVNHTGAAQIHWPKNALKLRLQQAARAGRNSGGLVTSQ